MRKNPLLRLRELGQSPWCDNIRRGLIETELKSMVRAGEIIGLTSNPTIYEKAIAESTDYDDAFEGLGREGKSGAEIFDSLAVDDIQRVADLLRPIYDESGGSDGFVSLEVSPKLADQTEASYSEARRLFDLISRPNAMIKIPGTAAGLSAIEKAIADGININVTLLFSIAGYERVAQAYLSGLEQRVSLGQPVDNLASVASFFVSRVDLAMEAEVPRELFLDLLAHSET